MYNETIQPPETNGAIFWLGGPSLLSLLRTKIVSGGVFRG